MMRLQCIVVLLAIQVSISQATILDDFEQCNEEEFGDKQLICDVNQKLSEKTQAKLTALLNQLQDNISCNCTEGCTRSSGNDRYTGLLIVTNSTKISETGQPLSQIAKQIYEKTELGNFTCDNGLLLIYIKDKQQLATFHGTNSFKILNTRDMMKIHNFAAKSLQNEDTLALQYLLNNYDKVGRPDVQRAETWTPIIGLCLALLLVLLVLALLLALFLARFCCCCARRRKHETIYYGSTMGGSKIMQPILVATGQQAEPIYASSGAVNQADAIYSTPYSGTLSLPPHHHNLRPEVYADSIRSASQLATPVLGQKHWIRPMQHAIPLQIMRGQTPTGTLVPKSRMANSKIDDLTQTSTEFVFDNHQKHNDLQILPTTSVPSNVSVYHQGISPQTAETASTSQRSAVDNSADSNLKFLDPKRKLEVQTRTDYIY